MKKKENIFIIIWRCAYPMLIHFGVTMGLGMAYIFILTFYMMFQSMGTGDVNKIMEQVMEKYMGNTLYILGAVSLITIPIYLLLLNADKKKSLEAEEKEKSVLNWGILVLVSIAMCISLNGIIGSSGIEKFSPGYQQAAENLYSGGILLELLTVGVMIPICEELIFRGLMFGRLKEYIKTVPAVLISALVFGIYHGNIVQGIYAFCLGVVMAACCQRFGTVLAPVLIHVTANVTSVCITEVGWLQEILEKQNVLIVAIIVTTLVWILGICFLMKRSFGKN